MTKITPGLMTVAVAAALGLPVLSASAADLALSPVALRAGQLLAMPAGAQRIRANPGDTLAVRDVPVTTNGVGYVRYARRYRNLPIIGGDFVVQLRNGAIRSVSQTLETSQRPLSIVPKIDPQTAVVNAGAQFANLFAGMPQPTLVVYALGERVPTLAYEVRISGIKPDQTPTNMVYYVDAANGAVLDGWDTVRHVAGPGPAKPGCSGGVASKGKGRSMFVGDVTLDTTDCGRNFQLLDPTRGKGYTVNMSGLRSMTSGVLMADADNVWGNGAATSPQTDAVDAHYGVAATWDYFKTVHGRNGIAGNGVGAMSRVHYGINYVNAFWVDGCFCMTFGDRMAALDVAGHEMSHGVTAHTAGLVYKGESGGLNEATSDIFGTMVEFFEDNPANPPNYLIGEKLADRLGSGELNLALRYMFKPSLEGGSILGGSVDCYGPKVPDMDPHFSSGVGNHFFYLLAEGAVVPQGFGAGTPANLTPASLVCNGDTSLKGIGRRDAEKIWYLALTGYFTSGTTYAQARVATLQAATDLFGAGSAQVKAVAATWSAVSVESPAVSALR